MDTELGRLITIGAFVVIGLGVFVLVAWLLLRGRGSPELRARRIAAILRGPISVGAPFELAGVARAQPMQLHLDLRLDVRGGADVEVGFRSCGVRLTYEILADTTRIAGGEVKIPADATKLGPDVQATDEALPSQHTHVRCTVPIGDRLSLAAGARVRVRGVAVPLPDNEVREMQLWIG